MSTRAPEDGKTPEMRQIEAQARANGTWLKAPNGQPSKLNERQWLHVRTAKFKQWFGDWEKFANGKDGNGVWNDASGEVSKIVDENGEPLVVYHGSPKAGFAIFDTDGSGKTGKREKGSVCNRLTKLLPALKTAHGTQHPHSIRREKMPDMSRRWKRMTHHRGHGEHRGLISCSPIFRDAGVPVFNRE